MALKDVKKYYLDMQEEYLEAKENQAEMLKEYKQCHISDEQLNEFQKYFDDIEINYRRLSYVMYLFNLPNRKDKKSKYEQSNKKLKKYFEVNNSTKEDIALENEYILNKLHQIIEEGNNNG